MMIMITTKATIMTTTITKSNSLSFLFKLLLHMQGWSNEHILHIIWITLSLHCNVFEHILNTFTKICSNLSQCPIRDTHNLRKRRLAHWDLDKMAAFVYLFVSLCRLLWWFPHCATWTQNHWKGNVTLNTSGAANDDNFAKMTLMF